MKTNPSQFNISKASKGFTIVEVIAAIAIVALIVSSVMVVIGNCIDSTIDLKLRSEAFELARENLENVLSQDSVKEYAESGTSDLNPEIEWETVVEADQLDTESSDMWVKATSTASYKDKNDEWQEVKLESLVAVLTEAQKKKIMSYRAQQEAALAESGLDQGEVDNPEGETDFDQDETKTAPDPENPETDLDPRPEDPIGGIIWDYNHDLITDEEFWRRIFAELM